MTFGGKDVDPGAGIIKLFLFNDILFENCRYLWIQMICNLISYLTFGSNIIFVTSPRLDISVYKLLKDMSVSNYLSGDLVVR